MFVSKEKIRQLLLDEQKKCKDIIDLRMALYKMFPKNIKDISYLFQMYNLE